jgi:hypothetical protein
MAKFEFPVELLLNFPMAPDKKNVHDAGALRGYM